MTKNEYWNSYIEWGKKFNAASEGREDAMKRKERVDRSLPEAQRIKGMLDEDYNNKTSVLEFLRTYEWRNASYKGWHSYAQTDKEGTGLTYIKWSTKPESAVGGVLGDSQSRLDQVYNEIHTREALIADCQSIISEEIDWLNSKKDELTREIDRWNSVMRTAEDMANWALNAYRTCKE